MLRRGLIFLRFADHKFGEADKKLSHVKMEVLTVTDGQGGAQYEAFAVYYRPVVWFAGIRQGEAVSRIGNRCCRLQEDKLLLR